jgi:predicted nucleic acid-binding Zn ribbon protein
MVNSMIMRTYQCPECNHRIEVTLTADEWDAPPPSCEACDAHDMQQEFRPFGIGGSVRGKAAKITEDIIANDYAVANFQSDRRLGGTPKVRYKDQSANLPAAAWQNAQQTLQQAIDVGRSHRRHHYKDGPQGNGLDVLKGALQSGEQPDLIAASKRRAIKVW